MDGFAYVPVAVMLGLPNDIRLKSIHTVVTKPVNMNEIYLGRVFGYTAIGTTVLAIMGIVGYIWILRQVPASHQNQLVSRIPIYGKISYTSSSGEKSGVFKGLNVGDEWQFRSFIEGGTKSSTEYQFNGIDVGYLKSVYDVRKKKDSKAPALTIEQNFEAFRSYKGDINSQLDCQITLINPAHPEKYAVLKTFPVNEYSQKPEDKMILVPEEIEFQDEKSQVVKVNLFKDIIHNNSLIASVKCLNSQQFLGMAKEDLFIRYPDNSFASTYIKSMFGIWLQMFLVIVLGVTATCFAKGPVSTILTGGLYFVGQVFNTVLTRLTATGKVEGGGPLESFYRLYNHMNMSTELDKNMLTYVIQALDEIVRNLLLYMKYAVPDFSRFNMSEYTKNGFDVPWNASLLPGICIVLGYFIPCILLGYISLRLREMEAK